MVKVIGITGGIATGKSTVTRFLRKQGCVVLDADAIAHTAYQKGSDTYQQIASSFDCLVDGEISRKRLGEIVFNDPDAKKRLEEIIHPYVREQMRERIANASSHLIFLDVPLLFEAHFDELCDLTIVVTCTPEVELARFMERNHLSKEECLKRMASQMPLAEKERRADYVIDNSKDLYHLQSQVKRVLGELRHV